jgi:hypothetical protein
LLLEWTRFSSFLILKYKAFSRSWFFIS